MRVKLYAGIFFLFLLTIFFQGCSASFVEKRAISYKQLVQNDMYIILTSDQYGELENLTTDNEINIFIDKFWKEKGIEQRNEFSKRVKYVKCISLIDMDGAGRQEKDIH